MGVGVGVGLAVAVAVAAAGGVGVGVGGGVVVVVVVVAVVKEGEEGCGGGWKRFRTKQKAKELVQTKNHTESPLPGDVDAVPRASTQHAGVEGCTANTQWTMVNSGEQWT